MTTPRQPHSGSCRSVRRVLKTLVILAIVGAGVSALGEWYKARDYLRHFLDRKTELARARERLVID